MRCNACKGHKKVPGLGGMLSNCTLCAGTGLVSDQCDNPQEVESSVDRFVQSKREADPAPKKRGRPVVKIEQV